MKLKVLPKSQRKHNHYLVLDIKSEEELSKNDFTSIVWDACVRFQGENNTSNFNLWTINLILKDEISFYNEYKAILRCQRDFEDEVRSSLALVNNYNRKSIAISCVGISGTIKGCSKFI
ncbi:Rpp14/Pop5 family protein [Methanobrevibacter millerae]|uniref:Ribonuclease P protein component 2 n=1 Tax=Methanobrevibacter millerae TaxID=230361 RepID=A0A0U3E3J2_9EURY|nr:Rpp14/Pop5 family protein [Methanobrevibacter millerae]ALT68599.1 ribonuclease P subunit P14 [Methanobrevibacter millerae]MBO6109364.1 ribonuclease P [Methanobrevibacter sp.]MBO6274908.1 ribonuclease P [Methanobrevibacter sp.]